MFPNVLEIPLLDKTLESGYQERIKSLHKKVPVEKSMRGIVI